MSLPKPRDKQRRRLERQFGAVERASPRRARPLLRWIRDPQAWVVRAPLGIMLIAGGLLAFLPVLGLWMVPVGLLLLAVDLPLLRGPVSAAMIRLRRRWARWQRRKER